MSRMAWPSGVLCLALLCTACDVKVGEGGLSVDFAAGKATEEWTRTYAIQKGGHLEIVNVNGGIDVFPSTGPQVDVLATLESRAGTEEEARAILRKAEIREEVAPDRVRVRAPENRGADEGFGRRPQVMIRYTVRIPPGLNVQFQTRNGEVKLENIQGNVTASSTNGGVTGTGLSGSLNASTVNGGIQVSLDAVTGESRLVTVNGGIRLTLAPGVNADLDASVVNGGVNVQDGFPLVADERSRQRVAGRVNAGGPRIVVQTTNGGIRVGARGEPGA